MSAVPQGNLTEEEMAAALGVGLTGLIRRAEGASAVVNAIYFPMLFLSGAFFERGTFPSVLRAVAAVLPLTYFIRLVGDVMLRGHQIWDQAGDVGMLAAWGVVGLVVALRTFRWVPHEG